MNDEKNWRSKISLDCPFKKTVSFIMYGSFLEKKFPGSIESVLSRDIVAEPDHFVTGTHSDHFVTGTGTYSDHFVTGTGTHLDHFDADSDS